MDDARAYLSRHARLIWQGIIGAVTSGGVVVTLSSAYLFLEDLRRANMSVHEQLEENAKREILDDKIWKKQDEDQHDEIMVLLRKMDNDSAGTCGQVLGWLQGRTAEIRR